MEYKYELTLAHCAPNYKKKRNALFDAQYDYVLNSCNETHFLSTECFDDACANCSLDVSASDCTAIPLSH